jgi:hypothetical protein
MMSEAPTMTPDDFDPVEAREAISMLAAGDVIAAFIDRLAAGESVTVEETDEMIGLAKRLGAYRRSMKMENDTAICGVCGCPIVRTGDGWEHEAGEWEHEATPK